MNASSGERKAPSTLINFDTEMDQRKGFNPNIK